MGLLSSVFGGGDSKQEVKNEPWSGVQPFLKDIYQIAQQQFRGYAPQYYPGQTFAPMDPLQMGAQQMALSQVFGRSSLPQWWTPQMPGASGNLTGSFAQPYNAPPLPLPPQPEWAMGGQAGGQSPAFGSMSPYFGGAPMGNPYIPGSPQPPQMPGGGMGAPPQQQQAPQLPPPGGGAFPAERLNNPLPRDEYALAPGQTGSAYDIGGGRKLYIGGAQSPESARRHEYRRAKDQMEQFRQNLNVDYDRSQFSDRLNDYLNTRVPQWGIWDTAQQNRFLNKLVGFGELESARRASNPEYAALVQQVGALR